VHSNWKAWLALPFLAVAIAARAAAGNEILIGQTSSFSGPIAGEVKEQTAGAKIYLDWVNANGGVYGRQIRLVSLDDAFDPKRAAQNARTLVQEGVFALFLTRGTPQNEAILPVLAESGTPLVAPSTGASSMHDPVNPLVFNVRTRYQTEAEQAIAQLTSQGLTNIAIVHVNDSFGRDCLQGFLTGMKNAGVTPAGVFSYDRKKGDTSEAAEKVIALSPQALVTAGHSKPLASLIRKVREAGLVGVQVVTLSNLSSQSFLNDLGNAARGTIVMQVFPDPQRETTRIGVELHHLAAARPDFVMSHMALEGFAAAKVLVEGLRRAGPALSRAAFLAGLQSLHEYDLGGLKLSYSAASHTGLSYVQASMVTRGGRFVQ
jgi:ABC-type branched-subunit amino acid transport system substrate-binding protein